MECTYSRRGKEGGLPLDAKSHYNRDLFRGTVEMPGENTDFRQSRF